MEPRHSKQNVSPPSPAATVESNADSFISSQITERRKFIKRILGGLGAILVGGALYQYINTSSEGVAGVDVGSKTQFDGDVEFETQFESLELESVSMDEQGNDIVSELTILNTGQSNANVRISTRFLTAQGSLVGVDYSGVTYRIPAGETQTIEQTTTADGELAKIDIRVTIA